jgi:hypothetical protein
MSRSQEEVFQVVYNGLIFVGVVLSIIALFIDSRTNANLYISSYTFMSAGITLIIGFLIHKILKSNNSYGGDFFSTFFSNVGPFILLIGILGFMLYLVISFKNKIDSGTLSDSYGLFSKLSVAFILIQLYITHYGMQNSNFKETGSIPKLYTSFSYLVGVINIFIISILATILYYFSTDG